MDYLFNNNNLAPEEDVKALLESAGYLSSDSEEAPGEDVFTYEVEGNVFQLKEEFVEKDGTFYVPISEMSDALFESVKDDIDPVRSIKIDGKEYTLTEEVVEIEDEPMVALEEAKESEESDETITIDENKYIVLESEEDADAYAYISESEDGDYTVVDSEEDSDFTIYLKEVE